MKCENCGVTGGVKFFRNDYDENEIICEDCLLDSDMITTENITHYYLDGEHIGTNENIDEVLDCIADNTGYTEVEEEDE